MARNAFTPKSKTAKPAGRVRALSKTTIKTR